MPDREGNVVADQGTETPLHAYKHNREESVEGDPTGREVVDKNSEQQEGDKS